MGAFETLSTSVDRLMKPNRNPFNVLLMFYMIIPDPCVIAKVPPLPSVTIFVTAADGSEGFSLAVALAEHDRLVVIGGVESTTGTKAQELRKAGVAVRVVDDTDPSPDVFDGCDWVFVLPPPAADRGSVGKRLLDACLNATRTGVYGSISASALRSIPNDAGVPPAIMLLSVVGAADSNRSSLRAYREIETYLEAKALDHKSVTYAILRTEFYQQNLLLWADNVNATCRLQLPLQHCVAMLSQTDVAEVAAALATQSYARLHAHTATFASVTGGHTQGDHTPDISRTDDPGRGKIYTLMGPRYLWGSDIVALIRNAAPQSWPVRTRLQFSEISRNATIPILVKGNRGVLDPSEAELVADLLHAQDFQACTDTPADDVRALTGHAAADITEVLTANIHSFRSSHCGGW
eukprot:m.283003 g.283003  ORF g.283003 m.283003 type:complete len:407 (-) comp19869_c0_seq1:238-1458(-)